MRTNMLYTDSIYSKRKIPKQTSVGQNVFVNKLSHTKFVYQTFSRLYTHFSRGQPAMKIVLESVLNFIEDVFNDWRKNIVRT